jgi:hypothetical protein
MKSVRMTLLGLMLMLFSVSVAGATTYTFSAGNLEDLDHSYAYRWGIDWSVPNNETIVGASLFFNDIRNWDSKSNDLYVDLLPGAKEGVKRFYDNQASGDFFAGQGTSLTHYINLPATAQDITYNFSDNNLSTLIAYAADGNFGLGFDPDCHFYNNGVSFTIETAATPIPAPILLLGTGLIGMAGFRRKFKRA